MTWADLFETRAILERIRNDQLADRMLLMKILGRVDEIAAAVEQLKARPAAAAAGSAALSEAELRLTPSAQTSFGREAGADATADPGGRGS